MSNRTPEQESHLRISQKVNNLYEYLAHEFGDLEDWQEASIHEYVWTIVNCVREETKQLTQTQVKQALSDIGEGAPALTKEFAEFFWANVTERYTNGFYFNQVGERVTVDQLWEAFQRFCMSPEE